MQNLNMWPLDYNTSVLPILDIFVDIYLETTNLQGWIAHQLVEHRYSNLKVWVPLSICCSFHELAQTLENKICQSFGGI